MVKEQSYIAFLIKSALWNFLKTSKDVFTIVFQICILLPSVI